MMRTFVIALSLAAATAAAAHNAPSGWEYPWRCCSGMDCQMVPVGTVTAERDGWHVATTGEVIPYSDKRVEPSPDGEFHQCARGANFNPGGHTICLFVPNQGS